MCGIAGYIYIGGGVKDSSRIINMLNIQKHRGPDDSGIRAFSLRSGESAELDHKFPADIKGKFEGVLGFNRLSILDLSSNGHQPMVSPDEKVLLTLNGEIYNAFDYKNEMEEWGYRFRSKTDTEIVLALYLKYGFEEMLSRLNGMFSIVIADLENQELYITRDSFGIKPMYYTSHGDFFAFSSELKSFTYLDNFSFELSRNNLDEYLLFRNNLNGTLLKGIESLEPGSYIKFKHDTGIIKNRYFDINKYSRSNSVGESMDYYSEQLESWLTKSVRSQLMSDVKLGCQLSGGIDSSLVTWLANRSGDKNNFESVSITFDDSRFSEEKYIDIVRDTLQVPAHKFLLDSDYYINHFERATWHLEAPLNHPNTIGIYKLSQCAKKYVTVLLSGEGADEVFGGYDWFYDVCFPFRLRKVLHVLKKNYKRPIGIVEYLINDFRAILSTAYVSPSLARKLYPQFLLKKAMHDRRRLYKSLEGSVFDKQVKYEMQSYLPDLLIRQDKMSMAHSIENRVPFLDSELVKNAFSIPEDYLMLRSSKEGRNNEKYILKKIGSGVFGNDFAFRNKVGFTIPLREFFQNSQFLEYLNDKLLPGINERNVFNHKLIENWSSNIQTIKYSELEALWVALSFEVWAGLYLDNNIT